MVTHRCQLWKSTGSYFLICKRSNRGFVNWYY